MTNIIERNLVFNFNKVRDAQKFKTLAKGKHFDRIFRTDKKTVTILIAASDANYRAIFDSNIKNAKRAIDSLSLKYERDFRYYIYEFKCDETNKLITNQRL